MVTLGLPYNRSARRGEPLPTGLKRAMCSVVLLRRPGARWPFILAGNRDEMRNRAWQAPGRHWPDRPEVVAGLDELSGGSWLGLNDWGVAAAVLNRPGSLGPAPDKRSRGELVLEALDHAEARRAANALAGLNPAAYRSFNLVVGDAREAYWIRHADESGRQPVQVRPIPEGVSMLTACDLNDTEASPRMRRYLPAFRAARVPDPEAGDWSDWQLILASRAAEPGAGERGAMTFETEGGFATVCASLLALPARPERLDEVPRAPVLLFADGPPDRAAFRSIGTGAQLF